MCFCLFFLNLYRLQLLEIIQWVQSTQHSSASAPLLPVIRICLKHSIWVTQISFLLHSAAVFEHNVVKFFTLTYLIALRSYWSGQPIGTVKGRRAIVESIKSPWFRDCRLMQTRDTWTWRAEVTSSSEQTEAGRGGKKEGLENDSCEVHLRGIKAKIVSLSSKTTTRHPLGKNSHAFVLLQKSWWGLSDQLSNLKKAFQWAICYFCSFL